MTGGFRIRKNRRAPTSGKKSNGGTRSRIESRVEPLNWTFTACLCYCNRLGAIAEIQPWASPSANHSKPRGLPLELSAHWHGDFPRNVVRSELHVCALRSRVSPASSAARNLKSTQNVYAYHRNSIKKSTIYSRTQLANENVVNHQTAKLANVCRKHREIEPRSVNVRSWT